MFAWLKKLLPGRRASAPSLGNEFAHSQVDTPVEMPVVAQEIDDEPVIDESDPRMAEVVRFLSKGQTIHAARVIREATGAGLADIKRAIDEDTWREMMMAGEQVS